MNYFTFKENIAKGTIGNLYLLLTREEFLAEDILQRLKKALVSEEAFNYQYLAEEKSSLRELEEAVSSPPFLGDKRLVVFQTTKMFREEQKEEEQHFLKILEDIPEFTCLIILAAQLDKRKKISQTFSKLGEVVELAPFRSWELEKWILHKVGELGKGLDRQGLQYLLEVVGKDLGLIGQELVKASLYVGGREKITQADLEVILSKQGEQNIFRFLDALGNKQTQEALVFLQNLLRLGEPPVKVLFMIHQQFRLLWQVKALAEKGYDKASIANKLQIKKIYPLEKALSRVDNFSWIQLERIMEAMLEADLKIKSSKESPKLILELLTLALEQK